MILKILKNLFSMSVIMSKNLLECLEDRVSRKGIYKILAFM